MYQLTELTENQITMGQPEFDKLWEALLLLRTHLIEYKGEVSFCTMQFGNNNKIGINKFLPKMPDSRQLFIPIHPKEAEIPEGMMGVEVVSKFQVNVHESHQLSLSEVQLLKLYLAYCLLPIQAHQQKRAISVSHFAQSLDGKIATNNGDSKWIGNDGNLLHAHRMRAICDGIMIGTGTLRSDNPSLTVRKVTGENPKRVVISSSNCDISSLLESCPDPVLVISSSDLSDTDQFQAVQIISSNGKIESKEILKCLYEQGICSVYIEGGSKTTSNFIYENAIDIIQLHISPQIFGSGISGMVLPEIDSVAQAIQFETFDFQAIGDTFMFVGEPKER